MLPNMLRPFMAAILGPGIIWLLAKLSALTGFTYTPEQIQLINDGVVLLIITGVMKVLVNKKANPGNAASSHLAGQEKTESEQIKADEKRNEP